MLEIPTFVQKLIFPVILFPFSIRWEWKKFFEAPDPFRLNQQQPIMSFMQVELDGSSIGNLQIQSVVRAEQATFNFCTAIGRSHYF
jgi:hypothetical protein